ncbi:MAG: hypothetical protein OEQ53_22380, partial [Saprospiraceae bacterium]|nr:hypothetical protein [Saprospiraceae bacterium]
PLEDSYEMRPPEEMIEEILVKTRDLDLNLARSIDWLINKMNAISGNEAGIFNSSNWMASGSLFSGSGSGAWGGDTPMWNEHYWHPKYGQYALKSGEEE